MPRLLLTICILILLQSDAPITSGTEPKWYDVARRPGVALHLDGTINDPIWRELRWLEDFGFAGADAEAPVTKFAAFSNGQELCFAFQVVDHNIVINNDNPHPELRVADGDRVELFFAKDVELTPYYCLEIDPEGRILDYKAVRYRKFEEEWDWPGVKTAAQCNATSYVVEGTIPLQTFSDLGLTKSGETLTMMTGIFRGEFSSGEKNHPKQEWISWVRSDGKKPDFHIPEAFGEFRFSNARQSRGSN